MSRARVYTACRDCKSCTNSSLAAYGRKWGRRLATVSTFGTSAVVSKMTADCDLCGHKMSLHEDKH